MLRPLSAPLALTLCLPALAQPQGKSAFTLLNPTPRELMRDLSTDRPDSTESPYTVDAGHLQVELSFVESAREDDGPRTDTLSVLPINLKLGLLNNLDVQFLVTPCLRERTVGEGSTSGAGDLTIRAKINIVGNDEGDFALALMPFITFPTGADAFSAGAIEGGLIVPWAIALPAEFSLGMMLELDIVRDDDESGHHAELFHTVSLSRAFTDELGAFLEYAGRVILKDDSPYAASLNIGLTYALTPDIQLDGGVRIGLTDAADDYALFSGISLRF